MAGNPRDPQVWFDFAAKDLARAHKRFAEGDSEDCLFHLQQTAEKACKGKLVQLGWSLRKTHDLTELVDELRSRRLDCDWFRETASVLTSEYITDRYPGFTDEPVDVGSLRRFLNDTHRLFEELTGRSVPNKAS
jgi:HEPN domain-containing protein